MQMDNNINFKYRFIFFRIPFVKLKIIGNKFTLFKIQINNGVNERWLCKIRDKTNAFAQSSEYQKEEH